MRNPTGSSEPDKDKFSLIDHALMAHMVSMISQRRVTHVHRTPNEI